MVSSTYSIRSKKIEKIKYKNIIINLVKNIEKHKSREQQLVFIREAIDKMFKSNPNYLGNNIPFMVSLILSTTGWLRSRGPDRVKVEMSPSFLPGKRCHSG